MVKQMISFTDPQRKFLIAESKRLGISIAELVRRIIDAARVKSHNGKAILLAACLVTAACLGSACAYHAPTEPTPAPIDLTSPKTVTLGALPGIGAQVGTAVLTAHVQNANGAPVSNAFVSFTTTAGSLSQTLATTEPDGHASVTLTATDTARVTVNVGTLSAQTLVALAAPPPAAVPSPLPVFPAPPPPTAQTVYLNMIQYARVGTVVTVSVSSPAINPLWTWTFGDGGSAQTMVFQTTHVYTATGIYDASVSSPGVGAAHALITIQ